MSRAQVAQLWALQLLDSEIERHKAEGDALRRALADDTTASARAALNAGRRVAQQRAQDASAAETALDDINARLQRHEALLYGGGAPKGLSALQQEIAHLQEARAEQEEKLLAAMEASEAAQAEEARLRSRLEDAERTQREGRADATERLGQVDAALTDLRERRQRSAAEVVPAVLARYEAIRRSRGGRAVSRVAGTTCEACRVSINPTTLRHARAAADLVTCDNCGRILYID
jgi:predicted  nucleic acid-binding Zn-ribbon protein